MQGEGPPQRSSCAAGRLFSLVFGNEATGLDPDARHTFKASASRRPTGLLRCICPLAIGIASYVFAREHGLP